MALIPLDPAGSPLAEASLEPAPHPGAQGPLTLLVIDRRHLCEGLSVQCFARAHKLTPAESTVLELLCEGLASTDIATMNGMGMATVRTQANRIREKTGAASIRRLIQRLATLPPMLSALRS